MANPLGHRDVSTTMIYPHVLNRGGKGVHSPVDRLGIDSEPTVTSKGCHTCSVCQERIFVVKSRKCL
jgi:hypothetical protein